MLSPGERQFGIFHIYFIFEFFKEGSPSAKAVFQGALR